MSSRFVNVDRETPMLLPPDLRDWVQRDDLAHFLVDALGVLDVSNAVVNVRGSGSEQYPPGMMLGMLIYCYAQGIFSSRQVERATYQHVSVRYLSGDTHPDHDTIAKFRRENGALLRSVFVQLLQLARASGLLRVGAIAIDGTKLKGAAAKRQTLSLAQIEAELGSLEKQVTGLLAQAEAADQNTSEGGELPEELMDRQKRLERLQEAREELYGQARRRHQEREQERAQPNLTVPPRGLPRSLSSEPRSESTINLSDPESILTPIAQGGFIQGYNAQIALSVGTPESVSLIVAAEVVREHNDLRQLEPMTEAAVANLQSTPAAVLADTGYDNTLQILHLEERHGVQVLCPPARNAQARAVCSSRYRWDHQRRALRETMRARLSEPTQQALYRQRSSSVEPAIGIIKNAIGFQRFRLRGVEKARNEWQLVALAFNCRRLAAASQLKR